MKPFWNSLQFKIPTVFILSLLLILTAIVTVFSTLGKKLLEQQAYNQVVLSGQNIVSVLGHRIALAESLATALANLGEMLPENDDLHKNLAEHILNYEETEAFIAGGGLWPAPYKYNSLVERRSFFWGRDKQGILRYYDDYNNPEGPGYHHEEWYVPAKHLKEGQTFWSKSYMDPYSYQPMVTVTVPMYRDEDFYGVSTVDLKLEGLHSTLEEASQSYGGYAFAVDRNGKFLSFPDEALTKVYNRDQQGRRTEEFVDVNQFAANQPMFKPLASAIRHSVNLTISKAAEQNQLDDTLADTIARDSYQIDETEARLISAVLTTAEKHNAELVSTHQQIFLDDDILLGEAAFAAVFEMPHTHWKIVTVMPYSKATEGSNLIYKNLLSATIFTMFISLIIVFFLVRRTLVSPIKKMSQQLKLLTESDESVNRELKISDKGELGNLVFWFNQRSQKLCETQKLLRNAQEELEHRVIERTEALQREIEKRKLEQTTKEARGARVEKQHAAIVELSLDKHLSRGDIILAARKINELSASVLNVARIGIWLIDESHTYLRSVDVYEALSAAHGQAPDLTIDKFPVYFNALQMDRSVAVSDISLDARTHELAKYAEEYGVTSLLNSPIRIGGKLIGVIRIEQRGKKREWYNDEIRFCGEIADQFLQVITNSERIRSERRIRQLAFYDPLTNLANRRFLQEAIQHELEIARRHEVFGSLLYLDLDSFKTLNDSLGHHVGDELLVQLSTRLCAAIRKGDTAARLGGDEFVVLITGEYTTRHQAMDQALHVAQKIQTTINEPYRLQGYEHTITSSIGITLFPEDNNDATDVLKQADAAMYRAKKDGRNTVFFYNPAMQEEADNRLLLEKELRTAISRREFDMYFQPQVNGLGTPIGAEALIRWRHPKRGIISPDNFIPVAEETGLILELGEWILHTVCDFSKQYSLGHVALNISPMQFRQPDLINTVTTILKKTSADPSTLMFELTEGIVIENIDDTIDKMNALKKMGIRISIDDFGTGYSSLAYLKQLPLDQLKINNQFVRDITTDPNDAIIVDTIISMAKLMDLDVVAEGVETVEQLMFLNQKGCQLLQGYYFSEPLSAYEFRGYMHTHTSQPRAIEGATV